MGDQPPPDYDGVNPQVQSYPQQGYPQQGYVLNQAFPAQQMLVIQGPPPPDYIVKAWASCLCFWPLALVAVIKASESRRFLRSGDVEQARKAGKAARLWTHIAAITGCVLWLGIAGAFIGCAAMGVFDMAT